MRDELGRVLCPHGRIMACAECGDDYERELQGPAGGARGDAVTQSTQSTGARAFVQELATLSMTAQSDPRASAQVYRSALIEICNRALKWLDALPPPQEPPVHTHRFEEFTVCVECGLTEAAIEGCHHCDEVVIGKRCWWCLRLRASALAAVPPSTEK